MHIDTTEYIKRSRKKKSRREQFTIQELQILLDYIKNQSCETITDEAIRNRDYAMTRLIAKTGLREKSVINAKIEDLSVIENENVLYYLCKGHSEKDEYVVLFHGLNEDIKQCFYGRQSGFIFVGYGNKNKGKQLTTRHVRFVITNYMRTVGIKREHTCVHALRNTLAGHVQDNGASVYDTQQVLAHKSPDTTAGYIGNKNRIKNAAERFMNEI